MPVSEKGDGRDHNPYGSWSGWPAAVSRGARATARPTRSAGRPAETPVSVHDLHATILHLLGLDHKRLTYLHNGRHFRLTDVSGEGPHRYPGLNPRIALESR